MSAIMMDKYSIQNIIEYLGGAVRTNEFRQNKRFYYYNEVIRNKFELSCWDNFLIAIVLWDEIWSFQENPQLMWQRCTEHIDNKMVISILSDVEDIIHQVDCSIIDDSVEQMFSSLLYGQTGPDIVERTYYYQIISNYIGINYIAHPARANKLSHEFMDIIFDKLDVIGRVDKELMDYYKHINNELGKEALKFQCPVLIDYIKKDTYNAIEELEAAMYLRVEDDVVSFRNQLYEIEQTICSGNTQALLSELKMVSDLAKDITSKYRNEFNIGEFSISLTPSLSFPLKFSKSDKRTLHATFIKRLLNYGVYERKQ